MPTGCDQDEAAGARSFQIIEQELECGVQRFVGHRACYMEGRGPAGHVSRAWTDNFGISTYVGGLVYCLWKVKGVLQGAFW